MSITNKEKVSLNELFLEYDGEYNDDFFWDNPVGKEIW